MNTISKILSIAALPLLSLICGCSGTSEPVQTVHSSAIRNSSYAVSGNMLYNATQKALQSALNSPDFSVYIEQHKKTSSGKIPLMQLGDIQNNTNDPDLQSKLVADQFADGLFHAGKIRVFDSEAARKKKAVKQSLQNVKSSQTPQDDSPLEMPDLLLSGTITTNTDKSDMETYEIIILNLQISDMKTCQNIWRFSTSFGTKRTRRIFGK